MGVPANRGGFETSIQKSNHKKGEVQGQTRQHARLLHLLGVEQVIVGINKMDDKSVGYSQDRYKEIKTEVGKMLTKIGFKIKKIPFIPMSGFKGDNLTKVSEHMDWFKGYEVKVKKEKVKGHTLLDALDKVVKCPKRPTKKPMRMPVSGVYKIKGVGDVITGRIEQGTLKPNLQVKFAPTNVTFKAAVFVQDHPGQLKPAKEDGKGNWTGGFTPSIHVRTAKAPCQLQQILWKRGKSTGGSKVENPQFIEAGDEAEVIFAPKTPLCVDAYDVCKPLGRMAAMDSNSLIMLGRVLEAVKKAE